jgi:hypothetical protein
VTRALVVASWLAAACGPRIGPGGVTSDDAILQLTSNVPAAQLYVDGRFIASLDALRGGVAIEPGTHRIELRHEDHFSSYLEVSLTRAERKRLALDMAPILP